MVLETTAAIGALEIFDVDQGAVPPEVLETTAAIAALEIFDVD